MVTLLAFFLSVAGLDSRSQRTITVRVYTGQDRITFDAKRISEKEVRRWMQLSPNILPVNYFVPEPLELCIEGHPEYRECGTRDWRAKNFIYNANVNLQKVRARIKELNEPPHPPELRTVISYVKEIQEDYLFFQSQLLKFFQDWQTENLLPSFDGINPGQRCSAEIARIRNAPGKQTDYKLAHFGWWSCINSAVRAKVGEYPEAAWKDFLRRYSIREEFIEDDID